MVMPECVADLMVDHVRAIALEVAPIGIRPVAPSRPVQNGTPCLEAGVDPRGVEWGAEGVSEFRAG